MKKVQGPTVRKTLTVGTSRTRWQPVIVLVAVIVVMSIVVVSGEELKHVPPAAPTFTVLHTFAGPPTDGSSSLGNLIRDTEGNLYGTTFTGGGSTSNACPFGTCGVVFKLSPTGTETILHSFAGAVGGGNPYAGLVRDTAGNIYGTTAYGGTESTACTASSCGMVFKLCPTGRETVLHSFTGGADGANPYAGLIQDAAGNLYGTTDGGGASAHGVVFKLSPTGTETVLHSFTGGADGAYPQTGLIMDAARNLYGTTRGGGASSTCTDLYGCGVVFKLSPTGTETVLYTFTGGADGGPFPSGLVQDAAGNLYGTTYTGGERGDCAYGACGVVFELIRCDSAPTGYDYKVLYTFTGGADGANPYASLVRDTAGNLYGTTYKGGVEGCKEQPDCGVVFKLSPSGTATVLHSFTGGADGANPQSGLTLDAAGNLYGVTPDGGAYPSACGFGCGVVFRLALDVNDE